eukprot:25398-Eustigmatos_ZCMA.PRE.1
MSNMDGFQQEIASTERWMQSERFRDTRRPYGAQVLQAVSASGGYGEGCSRLVRDVVPLRSSLQTEAPSAPQARKLWALLKQLKQTNKFSHTFGALDPVQ